MLNITQRTLFFPDNKMSIIGSILAACSSVIFLALISAELGTEASAATTVEVDFDTLAAAAQALKKGGGKPLDGAAANDDPRGATATIHLDLPELGRIECSLTPSSVMPANLSAKFPNLHDLQGTCSDGVFGTFVLLEDHDSSLSTTLYVPGGEETYYIDWDKSQSSYVMNERRQFDSTNITRPSFDEDSLEVGYVDASSSDMQAQDQDSTVVSNDGRSRAYIFRLALIANREYSNYHGTTKAQVMAAMVASMERVNGIYVRELGVFFQLIEKNDMLVCSQDNPNPDCDGLRNDPWIIDQNRNFIDNQGIAYSDYDIGHSYTTGSGGLACIRCLCSTSGRKAKGTTGLPRPENDVFFVDFVSHELGHQLGASHTFRDCFGPNGNTMRAVEPGSGSTIMSYAGICDSDDLQSNADPYFHCISLKEMRNQVLYRVQDLTCGIAVETTLEAPSVDVPAQRCTIPAGSKGFALVGDSNGGPDNNDARYSWERVDEREFEYNSNIGRFRSWKPSVSTTRVMPNMHFLRYGFSSLEESLYEIIPSTTDVMRFRFTARTRYNSSDLISTEDYHLGMIGDFTISEDVAVQFVTAVSPITFETNPSLTSGGVVAPNKKHEIKWNIGGTDTLTTQVAFEMAVNTLNEVGAAETFDYEEHLKPLDWVALGEFPNTGSAKVKLVGLDLHAPSEVFLRVRNTNDYCYFFDFLTFTLDEGLAPSRKSTSSASKRSRKYFKGGADA